MLWQKWNTIHEKGKSEFQPIAMEWLSCREMKCIDIAVELSLTCYTDIEIFLSKVTGSHSNIYNGVMGGLEISLSGGKKKSVFQAPWWENIWNKAQ